MQYPVIVRAKFTDRFIAEPLGIEGIQGEGTTAHAAAEDAGLALASWLGTAELYSVEIPLKPISASNPWLESFGRSADDPDFEEYLAEIERARELDEVI